MAVEKYLFLDETGVQTISQYLMKVANTRIKERITIFDANGIAAASYNDDDHTLSAKAILSLIGNIGNYTTIDGTGSTVLDKIKALELAIGDDADTSTDDTVYGEIAAVRDEIAALTHLTYEVVDGPISSVAAPAADKLYLQHDADAVKIGLDGFVKTAAGENATANDGTTDYYAYYSANDDKYYKVTETGGQYTVTETELEDNDPIFDTAGSVPDSTYNLYVYANSTWRCVGDTSLDLDKYWKKTDEDINALKNRIVGAIPTGDTTTQGTIVYAVKQAFDATDPYSGSSAYLDSWLA